LVALSFGAASHEIAVVKSVDSSAVNPGVVDRSRGCLSKQIAAGAVAVVAKRRQADTRDTDGCHISGFDGRG
jgi:hypothetical protein